jgi:NTP pyrophosphatase (non-canonical NTP hydrolase)
MVEEVGELARAVRVDEGLVRHGRSSHNDKKSELADVFLYVVHMANILGIDLATTVQDKEIRNLRRFLRR